MSGLFIKDISLMIQRKQSILLFLAIMIMMGFSMGGLFLIGYGTALFGILTIGTLSYDDYENCLPYLLTLPITIKDYAREKFLFCGAGSLAGWILSMICAIAFTAITGEMGSLAELLPKSIGILLVLLAVMAVTIPVQIKYGAEKSRAVMVIIAGCIIAAAMVFSKIVPDTLTTERFYNLNDLAIVLGLLIICAAITLVSYKITLKVLKNKIY